MDDEKDLAARIEEAATQEAAGPAGASVEQGTVVADGLATDTVRDAERILLVQAGGLHCAFHLTEVAELLKPSELMITPLPGLRSPYVGVARRLGRFLPVACLGKLTGGVACRLDTTMAKIVVCRHPSGPVAFVVDEVDGIQPFAPKEFENLASGRWSGAAALVSSMVTYEKNEHAVLAVASLWVALRKLVPARETVT